MLRRKACKYVKELYHDKLIELLMQSGNKYYSI